VLGDRLSAGRRTEKILYRFLQLSNKARGLQLATCTSAICVPVGCHVEYRCPCLDLKSHCAPLLRCASNTSPHLHGGRSHHIRIYYLHYIPVPLSGLIIQTPLRLTPATISSPPSSSPQQAVHCVQIPSPQSMSTFSPVRTPFICNAYPNGGILQRVSRVGILNFALVSRNGKSLV
jgi:hypothetical protein